MDFEEFDVFDEETDQIVLILDAVERSNAEKLEEFLTRRGEFDLELADKSLIGERGRLNRLGMDPSSCVFQTASFGFT